MPAELRYFFDHWGFNVEEDQFMEIFNKFDANKDGNISYQDL